MDVLDRLVEWGTREPIVRALVLTSSRARPDGPVDELSDYDVIVGVDDAEAFAANDDWVGAYGRPLVRWSDSSERHGLRTFFHGVVYEDSVKIDYSLWPTELFERVADEPELLDQLDVGYRVLYDPEGLTARWREPTYRAHIPAKPTEDEYRAIVEEFFWTTTYVAKGLVRGEVIFAKFALDYDAKLVALRRVLEWWIQLDGDWSVKPGAYGRGLERLLPLDVRLELEQTYVGTDVDENWEALFATIELFRRVAHDVADALGFEYPQRVDDGVTALVTKLR